MFTELDSEYFKRRGVLLLLIVLVLLAGGILEYHRQPVSLATQRDLAADEIRQAEAEGKATLILRTRVRLELIVTPIVNFSIAVVLAALPALAALAAIPWLASRFIHALYDTSDLKEAHDFLHRNVFGMETSRPKLGIKEGYIASGAGSLCDRVGGRGSIGISNDSAVVLERGGRLTRIVGPSKGFLDRFERVWEVVDLRPQHWPLTVDAMTKDGIPVSCQADVTFKIDHDPTDRWTDKRITSTLEKEGEIEKTLPYTDKAVFNAATSTWVRIHQPDHPEQLRKWTGRVVIGGVDGALRSILGKYRLDWLMQPPQPEQKHPREEIREQLEHKLNDTFKVGNAVGARILDVDLGRIDVKDEKISTQWVEAWQAGWKQRAAESRAEGEAELARLDAARIRAQAEMVLTLTEAIRPLVTSEEELPPYLLAMRFIETLRWMAYDPTRRVFLPPETLRTLKALEGLMGETGASPSKAVSRSDEALTEITRMLVRLSATR